MIFLLNFLSHFSNSNKTSYINSNKFTIHKPLTIIHKYSEIFIASKQNPSIPGRVMIHSILVNNLQTTCEGGKLRKKQDKILKKLPYHIGSLQIVKWCTFYHFLSSQQTDRQRKKNKKEHLTGIILRKMIVYTLSM